MNQTEARIVLLVEDNPADARLIRDALAHALPSHLTVVHIDRLSSALARLEEERVAVILLDLSLPDSSGFSTITQIQERSPQTPIVVLTGLDDEEFAVRAVQEGAQDYLVKGQFDARSLMRSLRYAIERHRLRQELRASEERYRNLFENASDAILSLSLSGEINDVNHGFETMLGWTRVQVVEQSYQKILTPASAAIMKERLGWLLDESPAPALPTMIELEAVRVDGAVVPIEIRDNVLRDPQGQLSGVLVLARDISSRKALERQRADFLAMLTHDIKNPLMALMGYTDYLMAGSGKRDAVKNAEVLIWMKSNAYTILSLVNNYLDLSRIEDNQLTLSKSPVSLNELLHRIGRQYGGEARHRQVSLELQLQEQPPQVEGDALALERVFANLVQNALKFTPKQGKVIVSSSTRNGDAVVTIADTGQGMAPHEIPGLFEKYRRTAGARQKEGWGLGLFIVKTLVEAHGGRIEVESEPGVGSRFHIFLPLKRVV